MMAAPDLEPVQQSILAALRDHPKGLTRPELADECEQDDLVVSRALAAMRGSDLTRVGLRQGHPIYVLGNQPMSREDIDRSPPQVELAPRPAAPTAPPKVTVNTRILATLEKFGPMTMGSLNKHIDCHYLAVALSQMKKRGLVFHVDGHQRGDYRWGLEKHCK